MLKGEMDVVSAVPNMSAAAQFELLPSAERERGQTTRIKAVCAEHGFPIQGIARVDPETESPNAERYGQWLERGLQGPLDYMLRTQYVRRKISKRFAWARAVVCVGAFYDGSERGEAGRDMVAHVARYARGRDYHRIFQRRLKRLSNALIVENLCSRAHYYVDTGPVLEKAWAAAAGLGWIGKNTCLIHPKLGSYFLLAELVLDSSPEPDAPAADHCGSCRLCLDVCPTQALPEPGVLDANRCLVTWNIEERGNTPRELWPQQGQWAAGCDLCQSVCPYNSPQRLPAPDEELSRPLPWQELSLADCITMDAKEFDRAFPGSALRRTSLKGIRLGAITAAGNTKSGYCREALQKCLNDADEDIRSRAMWAAEMIDAQ